MILYILAIIAFVVCLCAILWILQRNRTHLADVINDRSSGDLLLGILDKIAVCSFALAVIFSAVIGVSTAIHSFHQQGASHVSRQQ
ncbi:MAG: hypothetical protein ACYCPX_05880 [Acidiferrobacteraceae bacterium]